MSSLLKPAATPYDHHTARLFTLQKGLLLWRSRIIIPPVTTWLGHGEQLAGLQKLHLRPVSGSFPASSAFAQRPMGPTATKTLHNEINGSSERIDEVAFALLAERSRSGIDPVTKYSCTPAILRLSC